MLTRPLPMPPKLRLQILTPTAAAQRSIFSAVHPGCCEGKPIGAGGFCIGGHLAFSSRVSAGSLRRTDLALWDWKSLDGKLGMNDEDAAGSLEEGFRRFEVGC